MKKKVLILLSGGLDSAVLLAKAVEENGRENVCCLSILYGQKHTKELDYARLLTAHYAVDFHSLNVCSVFELSSSSLLKGRSDVEKGEYAQQAKLKGEVSTLVPFRNGVFISSAASVALSLLCTEIWYGAHKDDAVGSAYPDCSLDFVRAMGDAIKEGSGKALRLCAPFADLNKAQIVELGIKLNVPFHLTWSCYLGGEKPCGECATCLDRKKAFKANGIEE